MRDAGSLAARSMRMCVSPAFLWTRVEMDICMRRIERESEYEYRACGRGGHFRQESAFFFPRAESIAASIIRRTAGITRALVIMYYYCL